MLKKKKKQKKVNKSKGKKTQVDKGRQATDVEAAVTCKKTDGKGWRCKRPVHHPHALCQYHLAQVRNYGAGQSNGAASTEIASDGKSSTSRTRKKSNTSAAADADFYYYYSGFGPWRGKTRGGNGSGSSRTSECTDANDDCDDAVAGEDECTVDDEEDGGGEGCDDVELESSEEKTKRKVKKRGRKPVKARSLKSLL